MKALRRREAEFEKEKATLRENTGKRIARAKARLAGVRTMIVPDDQEGSPADEQT